MTCSDSFWFWLMRPLAEFAGALLLVGFVFVVYLVGVWKDGKREQK